MCRQRPVAALRRSHNPIRNSPSTFYISARKTLEECMQIRRARKILPCSGARKATEDKASSDDPSNAPRNIPGTLTRTLSCRWTLSVFILSRSFWTRNLGLPLLTSRFESGFELKARRSAGKDRLPVVLFCVEVAIDIPRS